MAGALLSEISKNTGVGEAQLGLLAHYYEKEHMPRGTRGISVRGKGSQGSGSGTESVKTLRQVWICQKKKKRLGGHLEKKPALVSGLSK